MARLPTPYLPGSEEPTAYYTDSDMFEYCCIKCAAEVVDDKNKVRAGYQEHEWLCGDCADKVVAWLGDHGSYGVMVQYLSEERAKYPLVDFKANRVVLNSVCLIE